MTRVCGDCQLCCKLLGVKEPALVKPAGQRCQHQKVGKGCSIYARRPASCRHWNCLWIESDETVALRRPDRVHYVIDTELDYVTAVRDTDGTRFDVPVIQVWVDPKYPDAHRDPGLRDWLAMMGREKGMAAIIRYDSERAFALAPPNMSTTGEFAENINTSISGPEHSFRERMTTLQRLQG